MGCSASKEDAASLDLFFAVEQKKRSSRSVLHLLENASPAVLRQTRDGDSLLHAAASNGQTAACKVLIRKGADASAANTDWNGLSPLGRAAKGGFRDTCALLISSDTAAASGTGSLQRSAMMAADQDGLVPLHWAAVNGHSEVCKLLLRSGTPIDIRTSAGLSSLTTLSKTPLQFAKEGGHNALLPILEHSDHASCVKARRGGVDNRGGGNMEIVLELSP